MLSIVCLSTCKLSKKEKLEILKLKDLHWQHGIASQLSHYSKNFKKDDLNNLFFYKKKLIGYTGLRKKKVIKNKKKIHYLLFDTLIIHELYRGRQFSKVLMEFNNAVIRQHKICSYLICKTEFSKFYKKFGWKNYKKKNILDYNHKNQSVMFYK